MCCVSLRFSSVELLFVCGLSCFVVCACWFPTNVHASSLLYVFTTCNKSHRKCKKRWQHLLCPPTFRSPLYTFRGRFIGRTGEHMRRNIRNIFNIQCIHSVYMLCSGATLPVPRWRHYREQHISIQICSTDLDAWASRSLLKLWRSKK